MSKDSPMIEDALYLLDQGASNDTVDSQGYTPLYFACQNGHIIIVQKILQLFPPEVDRTTTKTYVTPIYIALKTRNVRIWEYLIKLEAKNPIFWFLKVATFQA